MKLRTLLLILGTTFSSLVTYSQSSTSKNSEIIIRVDGEVIFGTVTEVAPDYIKYTRTDLVSSPIYTVTRAEIYAIVHANQTKEIITPLEANTSSKRSEKAGKRGKESLERDSIFDYNIKHGIIRVGLGFVRNTTSVDASGYKIDADFPGIFAAYVFRYNRFLYVGAQIGLSNFTYNRTFFSSYDQAIIDTKIKDQVISPGVFAKYNLTNTFIRPYLIGGLGLNISSVSTTNNVFFIDTQRGTTTTGAINGTQLDLLLRAGIDLSLSSRFGGYIDVGTGVNLVQLGLLFNLQ